MSIVRTETSTQLFRTYSTDCIESVKKLYLNAEIADVRFSFGTKNEARTQIASHKTLLAAASDVFKSMFFGTTKQTTDNIHVADVSEADF